MKLLLSNSTAFVLLAILQRKRTKFKCPQNITTNSTIHWLNHNKWMRICIYWLWPSSRFIADELNGQLMMDVVVIIWNKSSTKSSYFMLRRTLMVSPHRQNPFRCVIFITHCKRTHTHTFMASIAHGTGNDQQTMLMMCTITIWQSEYYVDAVTTHLFKHLSLSSSFVVGWSSHIHDWWWHKI